MIQKLKILFVLAIASAGTLALFSSPTAYAQGETWKLTTKNTIVVSGGLFNGQNGNPSSVTLTLQNPMVDPAIWVNNSEFNLKRSDGTPYENQPRAAGQFCITTLNTTSLIDTRTTVSFKPIHREDCNKGAAARYVDDNNNLTCGSGRASWLCNALWRTTASQYISPDGKVTYAVVGAEAPKCGDPGFIGPCATPADPTKADCTKTDGTPGQAQRCEAIKACILDANKTQAECTKAWDDCIATYPDKGVGFNSCKTAVAAGDLTGGRSVGEGQTGSKVTCAIQQVGWMICPIANFMAGIVDAAYGWITDLLIVPPINITITDPNNFVYPAWSIMRNFANVAFVIAFLIIVFSQLTSLGLNNYGIKKMLPRLIVAAILVNVSYFICAIAVDISNILGHGFYSLLNTVEKGVAVPATGVGATGEGWVGLAAWALAGTAAVGAVALLGPSILLPALIAALVAIVTVFLVLTLRQALIVILIFVSPLAFVAYLLPNTESLFKKWKDLFQTLLLMYPIIAIIFGASAVASKVVMASSPTVSVQIMGALVAIIPLAITPVVMKTAGGVLNRFGGMVNNPNKGPFDRMRKGAANIRKREQAAMNNKAFNSTGKFNPRRAILRRNARNAAIEQSNESGINRAKTDYIADAVQQNKQSASQYAKGAVTSALTNGRVDSGKGLLDQMSENGGSAARGIALGAAVNAQVKLEAEEVSAAQAVIKNMNLDREQARTLAVGGEVGGVSSKNDRALQTAAMQHVVNTGDVVGMNKLIDDSTGWEDDKLRIALADSLQSSNMRPGYASMGNLSKMRQGIGVSAKQMIVEAVENNTYAPEKIASSDQDELNVVAQVVIDPTSGVSRAAKNTLSANANTALTDPELQVKLGKSKNNVIHLKNGSAPPIIT